ncbi:alpha/beta-hydrolase [Aspergillus brunneoviolaceus CBS 621.78]|uniref:Alpha/beta-hydrolase n=1 Tax=Aspergillus brunneoviolaceus CBS 621.78 TaxID=1450534 RepID=A0ACD1G075_9EURO|nr:alpha/beta-hydrolase [Aspergillus brunneoviolaceus CBS 621.78]RAH42556.1 alpha/beta-hydrolase [Aspergillus brunneoviolaceus CBS 621.78]
MAAKARAEVEPLPKALLPLYHRIYCFLWLWGLKLIATIHTIYKDLIHPPLASTHPTLTLHLPSRPTLQTRIFYPPTYTPGQPTLLPTYINLHGGGFAVHTARFDDPFCASWSKRTGMLVLSLDYRKIPLHPFPTAIHDVEAQILDLLADPTALPIDPTRLVIGGFSAGASLALAVAQLPALKGKFRAAICYYPIVDFSHSPPDKMHARPYQDYWRDHLGDAGWWIDWGYVCPGQDRRDPLLSPWYAATEDLPERVYMVAAEFDLLRVEAQEMIHRLAGLEGRRDKERAFEYSEVAQADQDDLESQPSPSHHHGDTDPTSAIPLVTSVITTPHEHCDACERIIARREQRQNQLQCCGMVAIVFVMLFICLTIMGAVFARVKAHDD